MICEVNVATEPGGATFVTFLLFDGAGTQSLRLDTDAEREAFVETIESGAQALRLAASAVRETIGAGS